MGASDDSAPDRLDSEVGLCLAQLTLGRSVASAAVLMPIVERFAAFLIAATDTTRLSEVSRHDAERFLASRTSFGLPARLSTVHNRRNALRALFKVARQLGLHDGDPTLDARLPAKDARAARPLTDTEVDAARHAALGWSSPRYRLVWALAETTARGSELGSISWRDIDLSVGSVVLGGSSRVRPRLGRLTAWGLGVARTQVIESGHDELLVGRDAGRRVQAASTLSAVLVRAGLAGERDVRPASVAAWAGRRLMDESGDIARVAQLLGVCSLDVAARLIGWDWRTS